MTKLAENAALSANPFAILGVTTRDGSERIMEAAEDRSLMIDADKCQEARSILTNPRRRIDAELGWFPGVSPGAAFRAASAQKMADLDGISLGGIAKINAWLAAAAVEVEIGHEELKELLKLVSAEAENVELNAVLRDVNEDREVAGIPPFTSIDAGTQALADRRQEWRRAVTSILTKVPTLTLAEAFHDLIHELFFSGSFPRLLHEIIDDYALRAQPYIRTEIEAADRVIDKIRELAPRRPDALSPLMDVLEQLLATWERLTRPIQVSATLQGKTDDDSEHLAFAIRELSIDLFNDYDLLDHSRRLSAMVASNFQAIPRIADKLAEDGAALENIAERADQRNAEISYSADIGTFSKSRLSIDANALGWKGDIYPVSSVKAVRWGGLRRSINGIPTGTSYLIVWSDGRRVAHVDFQNLAIFEEFTSRIWKTVGNNILSNIVDALRSENKLRFGSAIIGNNSVVLKRKKLFAEEDVEFPWSDVTVSSADGSFIISGPDGSKASAALSYRDVDNVHFLEALIRHAFKNGVVTLSNAFA